MAKTTTSRTAEEADKKFLPVVIDSKQNAENLASAVLVPIFEVDGVTFSMPNAVRADIALEYLALSNEGQVDAAAYYLLTECLGQSGYDALKGVKGLSDKQFDGVLARVQKIALPKGRDSKAGTGRL